MYFRFWQSLEELLSFIRTGTKQFNQFPRSYNTKIKWTTKFLYTHTDLTIPNDSFHSMTHKLIVYHSILNRESTVPLSSTDVENEIEIMKQIIIDERYKNS